MDKYDVIVISDYDKGFLNEEALDYITYHHSLVFMDTKKKIDESMKECVEKYGINEIDIFDYEFTAIVAATGN